MGGAAGFSTGKAIAQTWRPGWHLVVSALALGVAVRFIHFALFDASLVALQFYVIDTLLVLLAGFVGFRLTRVQANDGALPLAVRGDERLHLESHRLSHGWSAASHDHPLRAISFARFGVTARLKLAID